MKKIISMILALSLIFALCACGSSAPASSSSSSSAAPASSSSSAPKYNKMTFTMAVNGNENQVDARVANYFKELIETATDKAITVEVYPNDQLASGNQTKGIEMLADGSTDIGAYATCSLACLDEKLSVGTIPWTFTSYAQAREIIDSTGLPFYNSHLEPQGIVALASFHNGFRQLSNSKHAVTAPEDLKGLKIRVPGSEVYMGVFKAFGADPVAMSWSEVVTALQQGTIDGQENGVSVTSTSGVLEFQKYVTIWNYTYENDLFCVNKKLWDGLNADTQAIIREKAVEACNWGREQVENEHDTLIQKFIDMGIEVSVLDEQQLSAMQAVVADLRSDFFAKYGEDAEKAFAAK